MDNKERIQRGALVFILVLGELAGIVTSSGALNYAHETGKYLYVVGSLLNLVVAVYAGIMFYRKYLKDPKL